MRTPFSFLTAALMLIVTCSGAAAAPTDTVTVVPAPEGQGDIFSPGIRLVTDLEQSYVEEEFLVSGEANLYTYNETPVPGEIIVHPNMCTLFTCGPGGAVPYTTRIVVRRPTNALDFNGTVVVEWWNSTAGFDTAPSWDPSAEYFARKGIVYVGVTNSTTSLGYLTGGCSLFGIFPPTCGTRYEDLTMPENGLAYEMVSQIANMLRNDATVNNPLYPDYSVDRIFHAGQSQQGGSMVTYATAFHLPGVNDGYFVQAAGSARSINSQCPCEAVRCGCQEPDICPPPAYPACTPTLQGADRRVATDLPVPVYRAQTESDMRGVLAGDSRQTDNSEFRYYEMAGTAHNTLHKGTEVIPAADPFFLEESCALPSNTLADGPIFGSYLYNAMWENMEQQVESATAPPSGDLMVATECLGGANDGIPCSDDSECDSNDCADVIECIGGADDGTPCSDDSECDSDDCSYRPARDANGNSVGGIRLPQMDLPTATYSFPNPPADNLPISLLGLVCRLSGAVEPFDDAKLAALYPDWTVFVDQFNQKIDDLIAARFLLPEDADKLRLFVESKNQQKCINGLNKNLGKVAKVQGKDVCGCIKDESAGKLDLEGLTAEACTTADRKGKVDKAKQKTIAKAASDCSASADFGATDATTVNQAATDKEIDLIHDIFGPDLDAAIVASGSADAKCQAEVAKSAKKCQDTKLKEFGKCKKAGLKEVSVHDHLTLAACMGKDPKGKIDKTCIVKLNDKIDGTCAGLDYATLFPGECAGEATLADFQACVEHRVECRVCLALNDADALDRNCDDFDDANLNASCSAP